MGSKHPAVDDYITRAAPFARPILRHLRKLVHAACPEVEEAIKWRWPTFMLNGRNLCGLKAYKDYCLFGFWVGIAVFDVLSVREIAARLERITSIDDLPNDAEITACIARAVAIRDSSTKASKKRKPPA